MCGIAGIITSKDIMHGQLLKTLASSLAHRGPDDEGVEIIPFRDSDHVAGLIQRRLSIIDLSPAGHQPMYDPETGNWIVFNGEIYNYRELRKELEQQGHAFRSKSDTEVILKAYASYGTRCLEKLRGMFAFGLFDVHAQKLFLAVDRFGIKPLYFYRRDGLFAFSSEVRPFLKAEIATRTIEPLAIESFLAYGTVQAPLTMIKEVEAMLPAQSLIYDCAAHTIHKETYWKPEKRVVQNDVPFKEALLDSVYHHLIADVPVALFLSGGVDSSSLAILVNEVAGRTLDSFSVTFGEKEYAEGHYARLIGEQFCGHHYDIKLSDIDLHQLLPQALAAMDQPTVDGINVYVISKAVHDKGIKVVLSGQGGDEVFGGYSTFARIPRIQRLYQIISHVVASPPYHHAAAFIQQLDKIGGRSPYIESKIPQLCEADGTPLSIYLILRQLFGPYARAHLLTHLSSDHLFNGLPSEVARKLNNASSSLDTFSTISLFELRLYLANTLLRDGDVMSMAHGLEVRVPYLDHMLVERVLSTPLQNKIDPKLPKSLLLQQVINKIPQQIYARPKMGFTFPWEIWLRGNLRGEIEKIFYGSRANEIAGLRKDVYQTLWKEFLARKKGITWARIWALYVLLWWIDKNIKS